MLSQIRTFEIFYQSILDAKICTLVSLAKELKIRTPTTAQREPCAQGPLG
jgi:hypothetical protein